MTPRQLTFLILAVALAAGLTLWLLTALGVSPLWLLLGALALSLVARFGTRR